MSVASFFRSSPNLALLLGGLLLTAPSCNHDDTDDLSLKHEDMITIGPQNQAVYPEGVHFDVQGNRFLVGSQTLGTIGAVQDDGSYHVFIQDTSLISSGGLSVDAPRDRLLVAVSDPGYNTTLTKPRTLGKLARVVVYTINYNFLNSDYTSRAFVRNASLSLDALFRKGKRHYANDIAMDGSGNAYVTDSYSPVIYKINSQNSASVFKSDTLLAPSAAGVFGLNGIVYKSTSKENFLLAVKSDTGTLLKIEVKSDGTAGAVSKVTTDQDLTGGDGMLLQDSTLLVVSNTQNKVFRLYSDNNWSKAATLGTYTSLPANAYPTTLTRRTAFEPYVLYSGLNTLQVNQQPVKQFTIQKVKF